VTRAANAGDGFPVGNDKVWLADRRPAALIAIDG
jgi:hypothetical protein